MHSFLAKGQHRPRAVCIIHCVICNIHPGQLVDYKNWDASEKFASRILMPTPSAANVTHFVSIAVYKLTTFMFTAWKLVKEEDCMRKTGPKGPVMPRLISRLFFLHEDLFTEHFAIKHIPNGLCMCFVEKKPRKWSILENASSH